MPSKKSDGAQGDLITLDVAGRLLMIGVERVRQLVKAGYIQRPKPGYTTIVSAVQGYIRFLKDEDRKSTKTAAASRATEARTAEIELRIAERKRDLIPQEEANMAMDLLVGVVVAELSGLPARLTRDVGMRRKYEAEFNAAKARIAKAIADSKVVTSTGRDPSDPDAGD